MLIIFKYQDVQIKHGGYAAKAYHNMKAGTAKQWFHLDTPM